MGLFDIIKEKLGLTDPAPVQNTPANASKTPSTAISQPQTWQDKYNEEKRLYEANPDAYLVGYRLDPKKGQPETLPKYFKKDMFEHYLDAYAKSKKYGNVDIAPESLAAILLQEGRYDFGFNKFDYNTAPKQAKQVYDQMVKDGFTPRQAGFAALINEKKVVAERTGMPFYRAWNGAGRTKAGKTGKQYAKEVEATKKLLQHEKNKQFYQYFVNKLTPQQRAELESLDYNDPFGDSVA